MTLKQRHRQAEMTTNDTKMGRNCDSDNKKHDSNTDSVMTSSSMRKNNRFWNSGLKGPHEKAIGCLDRQPQW